MEKEKEELMCLNILNLTNDLFKIIKRVDFKNKVSHNDYILILEMYHKIISYITEFLLGNVKPVFIKSHVYYINENFNELLKAIEKYNNNY